MNQRMIFLNLLVLLFISQNAVAQLGQILPNSESYALGFDHSCAIVRESGENRLKCWGANDYGQLGLGFISEYEPTPTVVPLDNPEKVAVGVFTTCAIAKGNLGVVLYCWGSPEAGGLGNGVNPIDFTIIPATAFATPQPVELEPGYIPLHVSLGYHHGCAIGAGPNGIRKLFCWGANEHGQLGVGNNIPSYSNAVVVDLGNEISPIQIEVGMDISCAVVTGPNLPYHLKCWGRNLDGMVGQGNVSVLNYPSPQTVNFGINEAVKRVSAGFFHVCAIVGDPNTNDLYCWGNNFWGQLGIGITGNPQPTPQFVASNVREISAKSSTCANINGSINCWGEGADGQLGLGNYQNYSTPQVVTLPGTQLPRYLVGRFRSQCLIALVSPANYKLQCWGRNNYGQIGSNFPNDILVPTVFE